jgi:Outer membrane protein (OmpH-like)
MGCNQSDSDNGPVAVIDLDAVAQNLGKDKRILQMIEQRHLTLNEQVLATQQSLIQQLNQKKLEFGDVSDEEAKELAQLHTQANTILASTRTQAQSNLTNFQLDVVKRFRADVKPIAMELATKKGCRVVLSKNDSVVFAFDETIDLTNEVTLAMQSTVSPEAGESAVKQASAEATSSTTK